MTRRLLLSYLSVAVFVLIVLEIPLGISYAQGERERLLTSIERDAQVVGSFVEGPTAVRRSSSRSPAR